QSRAVHASAIPAWDHGAPRKERRPGMSSRHEILDRVRKNQPAPRPLPNVPMFDAVVVASLVAFRTARSRMGGRFVPAADDQDLDAQVHALFPDAKVVC